MHSEFEMSMMGELNFFLGLQIKQLKEGTFINQAKYIRDLLKMFNMEEAKTPMSSTIKLDKDEKGKSIDSTMYRGMIESHLSVVKRILRYLKGTMDIGLWMGWLPMVTVSELIFSTLVRAFYLRTTYGIGGPIISTIRGLEIQLDLESIFRIFNIALIGLRVYESKIWPIMPSLSLERPFRECADLQTPRGWANNWPIA
ncbi:hypothetical protein CK203_065412 [Vitis vinifera]|uniref:Reverse transcriptase Ty1/copia-type domain-containing protein n=1 Tax=Vitis vinifera TaxID=29760 RepID=A0A438G5V6_VITVI|nr:hypothetical protein CK203_065412 [Vitis vinifera]